MTKYLGKKLDQWIYDHEKELWDVVIVGLLLIALISILYLFSHDTKKFSLNQGGKDFTCTYSSDRAFQCVIKEDKK